MNVNVLLLFLIRAILLMTYKLTLGRRNKINLRSFKIDRYIPTAKESREHIYMLLDWMELIDILQILI